MKRTFYALLLAAGAAFSLASCMNGDYDANPATSLSNTPNPSYDPGNGAVSKGTMRCKVNGEVKTFTAAFYQENGTLRMVAGAFQTDGGQKTTTLQLNFLSYGGVKSYELNGIEAAALYTTLELANPQNALAYGSANSAQPGTGKLNVTKDANNEMEGDFQFTAYQSSPTESSTEKIEVTDGKFYVG